MRKLLDIVITHWTEPWEVGVNAFRILAAQLRVDWTNIAVTVIHDGTQKFPDKYFRDFPFVVKQVCLPHGGISAARNYAITHSEAEWIKFCDFDDTFAGVYSVSRITDAIEKPNNYNVLWFPLLIDVYHGGILIRECSQVFIHDKIFRVSFLREKNVMFNESLSFSEDFAFLSLLGLEMDANTFGKIESNFPVYVYIQRKDSIGNRPDRWLKNRCGLFDAHCYVEDEMRKHGDEYHADLMFVRALTENYYAVTFAGDNIDLTDFIRRTWEYYDRNKDCMKRVSNEDLGHVIEDTNTQNRSEITKSGFLQWIRQHEG